MGIAVLLVILPAIGGCGSSSSSNKAGSSNETVGSNEAVAEAMRVLDKDYAPEKGGITSRALRVMRPLDVTKAPEDFRAAWSALIRALTVEETEGVKRGDETSEQFRDRLGVLMRKSSSAYANLEAVASRYLPAIKERLARRVGK